MEKVYRQMPFVKEATLDTKDPNVLHIVTYNGETDAWGLTSLRRKGISGAKDVAEHADAARRNYEERLRKGDTYFLSSSGGGYSTFGKAQTAIRLPKIVKVLRSQESADKKVTELQQLGFGLTDERALVKLVANFSASEQLETRLKQLDAGQ